MDIKDRLLEFINALGIKRSEFARGIEVTQSNVSDWVNRKKNSKPSPPAMTRISELYGLDLTWLITGNGEMFIEEPDGKLVGSGRNRSMEEMSGSKAVFLHKMSPFESRNITLPVVGEIAAGNPADGYDGDPWTHIEIPKAYLSDSEGSYLALRVSGDSMSPKILDGDYVIIHEQVDVYNLHGRICACETVDGITLKIVQLDEENKRIILKPLNSEYMVTFFEEDEMPNFRIMGVMVFQFRIFD